MVTNKQLNSLLNKKISCILKGIDLKDVMIVKEEKEYYILHNDKSTNLHGGAPLDMKKYKYSFNIWNYANILTITSFEKIYELW